MSLSWKRHELTSGSTWHSAGLIGQMRSDANLTPDDALQYDLYRKLKDETGHDPAWREVGGLRLASSANAWRILSGWLAWRNLSACR